jgi:glucose-1-phosphate cytidylyltransferase
VSTDGDGNVVAVEDMSRSDLRINGGFFVLKREILNRIEPGDELVEETFARLIADRELGAYSYEGFFCPMDTIKDRQRLESLHESGQAPWRRLTPAAIPEPPLPPDVLAEAAGT